MCGFFELTVSCWRPTVATLAGCGTITLTAGVIKRDRKITSRASLKWKREIPVPSRFNIYFVVTIVASMAFSCLYFSWKPRAHATSILYIMCVLLYESGSPLIWVINAEACLLCQSARVQGCKTQCPCYVSMGENGKVFLKLCHLIAVSSKANKVYFERRFFK